MDSTGIAISGTSFEPSDSENEFDAQEEHFMTKFISRFTLITILLSLVGGTLLAQDATPRLTIIEPKKDFGTVAKGEQLDWSFILKNTGNSDLQITNVQPACGCTVAEYDKVIRPGETGRVTAHVDTTSFTGPIAKSITIRTNDPDAPTAQVTIHAIVRPFVQAHPAGFVRYNLIQGDAEAQELTLYTEEEEPFEIIGIETPGEWVKVDYSPVPAGKRIGEGRADANQYSLRITVGGPTAPAGPLVDKIKVITNSKHQPEYLISLSGIIRPGYTVRPQVVNFGEVGAGQDSARTITLTSNHKDTPGEFKVERVETTDPAVFVAEKNETAAGQYEVVVRIRKDARAGNAKGDLKIYTSDPASPVTTIPLVATIKG